MIKFLPLFIASALCMEVSAQSVFSGNSAQNLFEHSKTVRSGKFSDAPTFIRFNEGKGPKLDDFTSYLVRSGAISSDIQLVALPNPVVDGPRTHVSFQQYYKGVKVDGGIYKAHLNGNSVYAISGHIMVPENENAIPTVSSAQALIISKNIVGASLYAWESPEFVASIKEHNPNYNPNAQVELVYFPSVLTDNKVRLFHKIMIEAVEPLSAQNVYVNAVTGDVELVENLMPTEGVIGEAHTRYVGVQSFTTDSIGQDSLGVDSFVLRDYTRGQGLVTLNAETLTESSPNWNPIDFLDRDNVWDTTNFEKDEVANDAHWGLQVTYDYFNDEYKRESFDGLGGNITSYVHYNSNWFNASWSTGQRVIRIGDGAGNPLAALDIMSHELSHGVTSTSADLVYAMESGALNESFSDIFGNSVEFFATPDKASWKIGEDLGPQSALRDMSQPNLNSDPDTYDGTFWISQNCSPSGTNDQCGVHTNSGVQNFWFYLLSSGGTGTNDIGDYYSVDSIGIRSAGKIAYTNLVTYLSRNSDYAEARFFAIQSAVDCFGEDSQEEISTTNAWHAVGVGLPYSKIPFSFFEAPKTSFCGDTATVQFLSTSVKALTHSWNFGDGSPVDTNTNPKHFYNAEGNYTVSLIACNDFGCDTLSKVNFIILDKNVPKPAFCVPESNFQEEEFGIFNVKINTIDNSSGGSDLGYEDFSCAKTFVIPGETYSIEITGSAAVTTYARMWIDANNDGEFSFEEMLFSSNNQRPSHKGEFTVPANIVTGVPLRIRVISALSSGNSKNDPCFTVSRGQAEDYGVYAEPGVTGISDNSLPLFSMSPNPARGNVFINTSKPFSNLMVTIVDLTGRKVYSKKFNSTENLLKLDVSTLSKGIFMVSVTADGANFTDKLILE
jgi:Zn-dependent metalloprotease